MSVGHATNLLGTVDGDSVDAAGTGDGASEGESAIALIDGVSRKAKDGADEGVLLGVALGRILGDKLGAALGADELV
jgi:hypothetical protein